MLRFSSVLLVDPRGHLLLQERDEHPLIDPERWGFVGGGVEDGEDHEAAAYRELEEETGIALDPGGLRLYDTYGVRHPETPGDEPDVVALWYAGTRLTDADVHATEGRRIVFVDPARVPDLPLTRSAGQALAGFLDSPAYRDALQEASR